MLDLFHDELSLQSKNVNYAPTDWARPCASRECTIHQLSPYIGKLKSSISNPLIEKYSRLGDLIVDPFSGSGTIPLEASLLGRRSFAADISIYSKVLTCAKLTLPHTLEEAISEAEGLFARAEKMSPTDLRTVPSWVRAFYNSRTLKEILNFVTVCKNDEKDFHLACLLGILHHQRPGFLSYPSSHLVPYLRNKKFPRKTYPNLYEYRPLQPRLLAKIKRVYKRYPSDWSHENFTFKQDAIQNLRFPNKINCVITSPPYMNTLDYVRDNRLRLWFLQDDHYAKVDDALINKRIEFESAIQVLAKNVNTKLVRGGHTILVIGDKDKGKYNLPDFVSSTFDEFSPNLKLSEMIYDQIPDIRRSRRGCRGTKSEYVMIFKKVKG